MKLAYLQLFSSNVPATSLTQIITESPTRDLIWENVRMPCLGGQEKEALLMKMHRTPTQSFTLK